MTQTTTADGRYAVLFICTGNYYRSRFAEALFNHLASESGSPLRAFSRGLMIHAVPPEAGSISPHTLLRLRQLGIPASRTTQEANQIRDCDFDRADTTIVLDEEEHRPMLSEMLPHRESEVVFWSIADLHALDPETALALIEKAVRELYATMSQRS